MSCRIAYTSAPVYDLWWGARGDLPLKVIRAERITDLYADRAAGRRAFGKDIVRHFLSCSFLK
jgi:hypothetical protein